MKKATVKIRAKRKPKLKTAASLTISKAHLMTVAGRFVIARWMRDQASKLEKRGRNYAPAYKASYQYR